MHLTSTGRNVTDFDSKAPTPQGLDQISCSSFKTMVQDWKSFSLAPRTTMAFLQIFFPPCKIPTFLQDVWEHTAKSFFFLFTVVNKKIFPCPEPLHTICSVWSNFRGKKKHGKKWLFPRLLNKNWWFIFCAWECFRYWVVCGCCCRSHLFPNALPLVRMLLGGKMCGWGSTVGSLLGRVSNVS